MGDHLGCHCMTKINVTVWEGKWFKNRKRTYLELQKGSFEKHLRALVVQQVSGLCMWPQEILKNRQKPNKNIFQVPMPIYHKKLSSQLSVLVGQLLKEDYSLLGPEDLKMFAISFVITYQIIIFAANYWFNQLACRQYSQQKLAWTRKSGPNPHLVFKLN